MSRGAMGDMLMMNSLGDGSTLSLDFTTMGGVLDTRLTFSRASTATFVNSSGYVEYAGANLQRYSETFATTSSAWYHTAGTISTGISIAPDGTTNCKKCSEPNTGTSAAYIQLFGTAAGIVQGLSHTISMWVKAGTRSRILFSVDSAAKQIGFDVTAGQTTPTPTVVTGSLLRYSQTPYPNDWYLCSFSWLQVNVSGTYPGFYTATGTGSTYTTSYTCDSSYIEIFGFQLNPGSTAQTYYPTTTAAYYAPRFDYSPTNIGEPRGLLIEGQAINYLPYSVALSGTGWSTGGVVTKTTGYATGPDGVANSATRFQMYYNASTGTGRFYYDASASYSTKPYTTSVWVKSNTGSNQTLNIWNTDGLGGTTITATPSWQRFQTVNTTGTSLPGFFYLENPSTNPVVVVDVLVYGAQLEAGSGASSYIPTGASGVTRAVDTAIIAAGTNFSSWYTGGTSGTFVANWYGSASSATGRSVMATSDQTTKHLHMYQTPSALTLRLADFGAAATVTTGNNLTANALTKGAFSYASTATSLCLNGGTVATGTLAFTVAPTWLGIGGPSTNGTSIIDTAVVLNNSIRTLKYFPARLSDAKIQELTT
jgi:hypothetical protein